MCDRRSCTERDVLLQRCQWCAHMRQPRPAAEALEAGVDLPRNGGLRLWGCGGGFPEPQVCKVSRGPHHMLLEAVIAALVSGVSCLSAQFDCTVTRGPQAVGVM